MTELLQIRVLDPACGSGNFLYVTMEHMKRLEGEVLQTLASYGERQASLLQIDPHQFLGLEVNPRAAHITEMVLWIGFLQWHYRTHGNVNPPEPVIRKFDNIQNRDALIAYQGWHYASDENGQPITRWDELTYKDDPATGRKIPDETAQTVDEVYEGVTEAKWPQADFIVGNPPFAGGALKRKFFGNGYFDAITKTYAALPESCDFVMYWWHKAAALVQEGQARRFGFITTNSIAQVFNRRAVASHLEGQKPLHLAFAIPDHPWVDATDGAAVRIAMTVGAKGAGEGVLATVVDEHETDGRERAVSLTETTGVIHADLRQGADITRAIALEANQALSSQGMKLHGEGFIVKPAEAAHLGLGRIAGLERHIRPYRNGRDIADKPRGRLVIDLHGLSADQVRKLYPEVYQWVYTRVKPQRDANNRASYRDNWWIFGEPRKDFRPALVGLPRYIATVRVAKHRFFAFLDADIIPESRLMALALDDAYYLGVLSSRIHVCWSLTAGAYHGVGHDPTYNNTLCFDPFPFPDATPKQQARIRALAEKLDAHRKARLALHPDLTMTGLYNVLEALRAGRALTGIEKVIHENGLVSILRELHDELDAAVADAYGWPADLPDEEILSRLVALNAARAQEEQQGNIRWLRPDYQTTPRAGRPQEQTTLELAEPAAATGQGKGRKTAKAKPAPKQAWPAGPLAQTQAVRAALDTLRSTGAALTPEALAQCFSRAPRARVQEILQALGTLGMA
ncbi:MAG: hypothetical protein LBH10_02220 [Burkholderiaceae bacterium]|nr:hypothetical protein [Burkholderiaceae bacterium]